MARNRATQVWRHNCCSENWLITESGRAGQRAAAIQTLFGTAQRNDSNPAVWLKYTPIKLSAWPDSQMDELLQLPADYIELLKQKN